MNSFLFLLITFCGLVVSPAYGSSFGVIKASTNATTKSTATYASTYAFQSGYRVYPGIGVLKFHNALVDWNEARETCMREGAHLAVIESAYEESTISEYQAINNIVGFWIGIHDQFKSRSWVTLTDKPMGYAHWNNGEPNNAGGNERCVSYEKQGFNDVGCDQKRMFVCKIQL